MLGNRRISLWVSDEQYSLLVNKIGYGNFSNWLRSKIDEDFKEDIDSIVIELRKDIKDHNNQIGIKTKSLKSLVKKQKLINLNNERLKQYSDKERDFFMKARDSIKKGETNIIYWWRMSKEMIGRRVSVEELKKVAL